jgi:hypothetical protein
MPIFDEPFNNLAVLLALSLAAWTALLAPLVLTFRLLGW